MSIFSKAAHKILDDGVLCGSDSVLKRHGREFRIVHKNKLFTRPSTDKEVIDDDENGLLDVVRVGWKAKYQRDVDTK